MTLSNWNERARGMSGLGRHLLLTMASSGILLSAALVAAVGQQPGQLDPERAFTFGDSNLDGKLSLAEFRELLTNGPRPRKAAKKAVPEARLTPLFRRLDANGDGELSVKEFRQITVLRGAAGGGLFPRKRGRGCSRRPRLPGGRPPPGVPRVRSPRPRQGRRQPPIGPCHLKKPGSLRRRSAPCS